MKHVIVESGVVVQVQPDADGRTIEAPDVVVPGYLYSSGNFTAPAGPTLAAAQARAKAMIDAAAETARQRYVTPGAAQQAVYLRKAEEAERLASDGSPDPADYPLLSASVGIEAGDLAGVATIVLATRDAWLAVAATIETERLGGKADVDVATDTAGVDTVLAGLSWPSP